jgi:hypothetical protein
MLCEAWSSFGGLGAKNLSKKQLLSSYVKSRGVQLIEVGHGTDGLWMWEYVRMM